jgi:hypothetical protein
MMIFGYSLGVLVEGSVAFLLLVTIAYCIVLNERLKRLHTDRETLSRVVGDLVQATGLANSAIKELKTAALEADTKLDKRLEQAEELERQLAGHLQGGTQLIEKITRIIQAAKSHTLPETKPEPVRQAPAAPAVAAAEPIEPQSRLHSALQQLAMRKTVGGRAA